MNIEKHINTERVKELTFEQFKKEMGEVLSKYSLDAISIYKTLKGGTAINKIQETESRGTNKEDIKSGKRTYKKRTDKSNI